MDNNQKLTQYDVDGSLYAMMRAAQAKQDKEHMKLCMAEAQKRKKNLALIMKDMPMEKSQELKQQVADRLVKSFADKELTVQEQELISIDVMTKAVELAKSEAPASEADNVAAAAGTEVIQDPTATKQINFAGNLFKEFNIGSTIKNQANGQAVLEGAKKQPQDYVANGNKANQKSYTAEQLKEEITPKKA